MAYRNPDSRRNWAVLWQDKQGDWMVAFLADDEHVSQLEDAINRAGRSFVSIFLPDHEKTKPFRWAGAISEGTLRPEDLIPKMLEVMRDLGKGSWISYLASTHADWQEYIALADAGVAERLGECDPESVSEFQARLEDELNDAAPEGYVFGGHEGDPASIGFWRTDDEDAGVVKQVPVVMKCYSDHNEDIRTKGSCDLCHGTEVQ